ncbi:zinc finger C2H2 type [Echinococcus multilocularis]|uniref:Zinc finger C2H2 type n=1 Tax=Echinococcus multilocularis TaxID=6211 RepID=A0A068Y513_ECHMU|nr:zinc finger C2H2 type [Echinococcus multilocularis]
MAAVSAIGEGTLADSPLPSSSSAASSLSTSSNLGDFDSCEGYLVVTFSRNNKPPPPTRLNEDANVGNSEVTATTPLSINATPSPKVGTRISRLAAMAAGVDISQLQHSTTSTTPSATSASGVTASSSTSPPSSCDYVRRFTYPDGDTHYDWLSCPLAEMQAKGPLVNSATAHSLYPSKPISLATVPRKSFLVYDSSLPSVSVPTSSCYRRQLTTSRKMLRCEECGKYYGNEYSLHHHICLRRKDVWKKGDVPTQLVDGQLTYFCPVCSKPFKWLGNLTRHYYVHTGQRFFKCDICHKEFFSAYQVRRHMNSHTGLRFQCAVCEKPFTCKYACAWHARQHLKEQQQQKS